MKRTVPFAAVALRACVACLLLSAAALAADGRLAAVGDRVSAEMRKLNQKYDEVKKVLDEEYVATSKERDDARRGIFESVKNLKQEREKAIAKLSGDVKAAGATMAGGAVASPAARRDAIDSTYRASLATLQQLYQLNAKRYNELVKIHNAREALEKARHREERDMTAEKLRREAMENRGADLADADRRVLKVRQAAFDARANEADNNYHAMLGALDEYKSLVESRLKAQQDYLTSHAAIMKDLASADLTPEKRDSYQERLNKLNAEKDAEERQYLNNAKFIEEKMNFERQRTRETARLADERRQVEQAWYDSDASYADEIKAATAAANAGSLTADEKAVAKDKLDILSRRRDAEREAYQQALATLDDRQKLLQKAMDERHSYIEERNDIRLAIAKEPMTREAFDKYRNQIAVLEEKRIARERDIRDRMGALGDAMPAAYRTLDAGADLDARRERMANRMSGIRGVIENRFIRERESLRAGVKSLDDKLSAAGLADADRESLLKEKASLEKRIADAQARFDKNIQIVDARKKLEDRRMAARAQYIAKRNALRDGFRVDTAGYGDIQDLEKRLRDLEHEYVNQDHEYRRQLREAGQLLPTLDFDGDASFKENVSASWQRGLDAVSNGSAPAGTPAAKAAPRSTVEIIPGSGAAGNRPRAVSMTAPARASAASDTETTVSIPVLTAAAATVTPTTDAKTVREAYREINDRDEDGKSAWESLREAVVDSYQSAVHYLTD